LLFFLDYGHYPFEKVWEPGLYRPPGSGKNLRPVVKLQKLAPRHPSTVLGWKYSEGTGDFIGIEVPSSTFGVRSETIEPDKLLVFTLDEEAGDLEGTSILRSAYKHWYYKENLYKVDAIQKERHGIGIPQIKLPPGYKDKDETAANEMGENLRTNEKAHVVTPPGWEIEFLELKGQPVDVLESAAHHGEMIIWNVLANFLSLDQASGTQTGSLTDVFNKAVRYLADYIRWQHNQHTVPQIVDYNYRGVERYPELRVRRLSDNADWRALSVALRNLGEPGFLTPDSTTEAFIRDIMDMPAASAEAMKRDYHDRILKGQDPEGVKEVDNPGSSDPGRNKQRQKGKSGSGGPTE
jgi:hypothetical protein